jgi:hypothetical protein
MATQKKAVPARDSGSPREAVAQRDASTIPLVELSAQELSRLKRPRLGFEWHFDAIIGLAVAAATLRPRGFDDAQLREDLQAYRALEAEEERVANHLARVKATRLARSARVWATMMEIYARARAAARSDADLARHIADFQAFMKLGPRKKKP